MEHIPVMLNEAIQHLEIKPNGVYVDATLGGGTHASAILKNLDNGQLIAFDQDEYALNKAKETLAFDLDKVTFIHSNFKNLKAELKRLGIYQIDGILFDLGVSSFHFDDIKRGFSYREDAFLDMRMDQRKETSAHTIVNSYSESQLKDILYRYGDEKFAPRIAKNVVRARQKEPINSTLELVRIIKDSYPKKALSQKGHPAKKTFQALRIEVNDELNVLKTALNDALDLLQSSGRIVVISFQSLEDKIVKQIFKEKTTIDHPKDLPTMPTKQAPFLWPTKKSITPSPAEITANHRAHSAKMRVLEKR